jgi:hypothetical protein
MNKSFLAVAAVATLAGSAHAMDRAIPAGMSATAAPSANASAIDPAIRTANPAAVTVLNELPVVKVSAACGCYAGPVHCED